VDEESTKVMHNNGLMIYIDPAQSLRDNILWAARRHRRKFETDPNVCYVHPDMNGEVKMVGGIVVRAKGDMLQLHLWVGKEGDNECHTAEG
jgi:hypothetical protein